MDTAPPFVPWLLPSLFIMVILRLTSFKRWMHGNSHIGTMACCMEIHAQKGVRIDLFITTDHADIMLQGKKNSLSIFVRGSIACILIWKFLVVVLLLSPNVKLDFPWVFLSFVFLLAYYTGQRSVIHLYQLLEGFFSNINILTELISCFQ